MDELLKETAEQHTKEHGHKTAYVYKVGWLCAVCDEDFEEFIQEHPDFQLLQVEK